ncbi:hypothetical protein [uncultured Fibrobacter sp.]|uniref:hypothetical protein n=1 Tax=uncultured Fibrobacter sp. TaxID=261512 RepID=UPI002617E499|nr:hypothetical protein [uncultured Fibrobacter sp.]
MPFLKKRPWIAIALVVACICMWGCGLLDDEERFVVDKNRTNGYLVAIIDDSLAVMENLRGWELWDDDCNSWEYCDKGTMNPGLFLVNYRKKQSPLWGDTVEGRISIVYGYYHDSSAMFSNADDEFGFWRIGEKPRVVRKWNCEAPCECNCGKYGRPWIGGNVLLKMELRECPVAVLDTATGIVKKLEFTGEYAWLEGCDDITYVDGDVVCLKALYDEKRYGVYEYGKDGLMDSLIWNDANWSIYTKNVLEIRGNMFTIKHPTKMIDGKPNPLNGTFIHYLKPLGTPVLPVRMEYNNFVDSTGFSVGYSFEDLIVTK